MERCDLCGGRVDPKIVFRKVIYKCISCEKTWCLVGVFPDLAIVELPIVPIPWTDCKTDELRKKMKGESNE